MEGEYREKYLITGAGGQLGYELHRQLSMTDQSIARTQASLDITKTKRVSHWLQMVKPAAIVNCAAYTNVQRARTDFRECWETNAVGINNLAGIASWLNIPLIHISSDFVFGLNPRKHRPYWGQDILNPTGHYGFSKSCGEHAMLSWMAQRRGWRGFIVRTAGLFEQPWRYRSNFPQKIWSQLHCRAQQTVPVVKDVWTNLTYAPHLAKALRWMLKRREQLKTGIYHITNQGPCTWYEAAKVLASHTRFSRKVVETTRAEYAKLNRCDLNAMPVYTCLDQGRYQKAISEWETHPGPRMPPWQDAIKAWVLSKRKQDKERTWDMIEEDETSNG